MSLESLKYCCSVVLLLLEDIFEEVFIYLLRDRIISSNCVHRFDLICKSHNAPVPYPTMHHSEQKCAHFCSEWCIMGYGRGALWDLWDWSIASLFWGVWTMFLHARWPHCRCLVCKFMAYCKTVVSPVLIHWRYYSLAVASKMWILS